MKEHILLKWKAFRHLYAFNRFFFSYSFSFCLQEALKRLCEGVKLPDFTTLPAKVELLKEDPGFPERNPSIRVRKNSPTSWIKLILIGMIGNLCSLFSVDVDSCNKRGRIDK